MDLIIIIPIIAILALFISKPEYGVYLTAFCLPIIGWNFNFGSFVVPFSDLIAGLSLAALALRLAFLFFFGPEKLKLRWPLFFPFALFFAANLLSIAFANNPAASFYYFLRWPVFLYFAYIFAPANIISSPAILKKTVSTVFLSALTVLISGFASLFGQDWRDSFFRIRSINIQGVFPFGENHNLIAEYLNIGAFFVLIIREFLKEERWRRLADIVFFLSVIGVALTFSRTGWITIGLQTVIYLAYRFQGQRKERFAALMFLLLLLAAISPVLIRMSALQEKNASSTESRLLLTEISWQAFQERPITGYGSGSFVDLVGENIRFRAKYGEPLDSHGMVQKLLAENGLLGLLAWFFILAYVGRIAYLALRRYYPRLKWMLPFALAAGGGLFFQFFNTSYYKGKVWFPLVLFLIAVHFTDEAYVKKNKGAARLA